MGCRFATANPSCGGQGAAREHPPNGAVTEPQRRRQPIFNATLRAGTPWRFSSLARWTEVRAGRALAADIGAALAPWRNRQIASSKWQAISETGH
ncbi:MAG: hypothetical protein DME45_00990 [Verrucomicrobia bacterium]|nr:MAG: hypothetical protein DME45_00990 [Verrucomicrobiota bacterium]